jgi:hypothetical protein
VYKKLYSIIFLFISINCYSIDIEFSYTLLNGSRGSIIIPNDIVEIDAFKGNINFIRNNGETINLKTISPMVEIYGIEKLYILNRMELSMQLNGSEIINFLKNDSVEYLFLDYITLSNMDFLSNFPNLKYLALQSIKYNDNKMDLKNSQIQYFIVSYIQSNEEIELIKNTTLKDFIVFYSSIKINNDQNINITNNYNDFINEPKYFKRFMW